MIFVTVGTHEQQFNRLVKCIDELKMNGTIEEDVVIQTGFSTYEPQKCEWQKLYSYNEMINYVNEARIVITHGGPSSFIMPLQVGKVPIVVPRQKKYEEHVNDHQVKFVKHVAMNMGNIVPVYDIKELKKTILYYEDIISGINGGLKSNNEKFNDDFEKIVSELMNTRI